MVEGTGRDRFFSKERPFLAPVKNVPESTYAFFLLVIFWLGAPMHPENCYGGRTKHKKI